MATITHEPLTANIFDEIHDELDQRVFNGTTPRRQIVKFVKRIYARAFEQEFKLDFEKHIDLYLTGSLTTYQFSDTSDFDVTVFPRYDLIGGDPSQVRKRLVSMSIDKLDGTFLPGGLHPVQFFVEPDGVKPTDKYRKGERSGWSFRTQEWIVPPERDRVHDIATELPLLYSRAEQMANKMRDALDHDPEMARELWRQIHQKRTLDQNSGLGDFSEGNIIYKYLLHEGLFDRIRGELHEYIAAVNDTFIRYLVNFIEANRGDTERVFNFLAPNNERYSPEEIRDAIEQANVIYLEREAENEQKRLELKEQIHQHQEEQKNWIAVRWGLNRATGEVLMAWDDDMSLTHPDMLERWERGNADAFTEHGYNTDYLEGNYAFGYADYNTATGEVVEGDDSFDLYELSDPPPEDWEKIKAAIAGWAPAALEEYPDTRRKAKVADMMDAVTMMVIYDFSNDRIMLGTMADAKSKPDTRILGEYDGTDVWMYHGEDKWMNVNYFRRLWQHSFPRRRLENVFLRDGDAEHKLAKEVTYETAWVYLGKPHDELLIGGSEHSDLIYEWMADKEIGGMPPDPSDFHTQEEFEEAEADWEKVDPADYMMNISFAAGHIGYDSEPPPIACEVCGGDGEVENPGYNPDDPYADSPTYTCDHCDGYGWMPGEPHYVYTIYSDFLSDPVSGPETMANAIAELKRHYPDIKETNDASWAGG